MAEPKTKPTNASVTDFLDSVDDEQRRADCYEVMKMMEKVTKQPAKMWGTAIVGFGSYTYKYASGNTGDWPLVGFSPRKQALTLYVMANSEYHAELLGLLGKFTFSKACLYVKKLDDIDRKVLKELIKESVRCVKEKYNVKKQG